MQTEYIDITPTWSDLLPSLVQVAVYGKNKDSVTTATNSLRHMAKQADRIADLEQQNRELLAALQNVAERLSAAGHVTKVRAALINEAQTAIAKATA